MGYQHSSWGRESQSNNLAMGVRVMTIASEEDLCRGHMKSYNRRLIFCYRYWPVAGALSRRIE